MKYLTSSQASEILNVCEKTLQRWADAGKIDYIRTAGGHRRYNVKAFIEDKSEPTLATVCYCRVSSAKQLDDLERQVAYMRTIYPTAEVIRDIGSGLNFKRKGLKTLLDRLLSGDKLSLVVAHRDTLARFGFEMFRYMVESNGGELVVLDNTVHSPGGRAHADFSWTSPPEELTTDLLSILHLFSCRMHGLRRYSNQIKADKNLSKQRAEEDSA